MSIERELIEGAKGILSDFLGEYGWQNRHTFTLEAIIAYLEGLEPKELPREDISPSIIYAPKPNMSVMNKLNLACLYAGFKGGVVTEEGFKQDLISCGLDRHFIFKESELND